MWKPTAAVTLLLVVVAAQTAVAGPGKPTLRATHLNPLTVVGTSFARSQRLSVAASSASKTQTRLVATTKAGTFTASFNLKIDPCLGGTTVIVRRAGRTATLAQLKLPARECPPSP